MNSESQPRFRLALLGGFALESPGGPVEITSRKVACLLAALASSTPHPQGREKLASLLWGSQEDAQARQNLRQALTSLRRILGDDALISSGQAVGLAPSILDCDVARFAAAVAEGSLASLREAAGLYRGPFMADAVFGEEALEDWAADERRRLDGMAVGALTRLAELELAHSHPAEALAAARRAITVDNLREDAHRLAIMALSAQGRRTEALRHYHDLQRLLARELDVEPDAETQSLVAKIHSVQRAAGAGAAAAVPAAAPPAGGRQSAPLPQPAGPGTRDLPSAAPPLIARGMVRAARSAQLRIAARLATWLSSTGRDMDWWRRALWPFGAALLLAATLHMLVADGIWPPIKGRGGNVLSAPPADSAGNEFAIRVGVLPFAVGNATLEPLAARLADALAGSLSRTGMLRVVAGQSASSAAATTGNVVADGARLGVAYILRGAIDAEEGKLHADLALIDVRSGAHVWSRRFVETQERWQSVKEDIVRQSTFAAQLVMLRRAGAEPVVAGHEQSVGELLGRGWAALIDTTGSPAFESARSIFTEVLRRDPNSTGAMVGLAAYYLAAISDLRIEREPFLSEAEALLRQALSRTTQNSAVHYHLGILNMLRDNLPAALESFNRVLEINPSHAPSYARRGRVLIRLQRYGEALEAVRYGIRLNDGTIVPGWQLWVGWVELELGHDDEARYAIQTALAASAGNSYAHASLAALAALTGDLEAAQHHATEARKLTPHLDDLQRLVEFNRGPDGRAIRNRLDKGLRLAFGVPE